MLDLNDLCDITSGYSFRGKVADEPDGAYPVIQLGDVDWTTGRIAWESLPRVSGIEPAPHHLLRAGDVLFAAKGRTNRALYLPEIDEAVAASTFFVIRPKDDGASPHDRALPGYIAWYINTAPAQAHLLACRRGTNIRSIPKTCIGSLPVPLPPLEVQHRIAEAVRLAREERDLTATLAHRKAQLVEATCLRSAHQHG